MRALVFDGNIRFNPHQPEPSLQEGDALVRVRCAGICGGDLQIASGCNHFTGVLGHEFVGRVEQSPSRELIGKRVVGQMDISCGRCDLCQSGLSNHCRHRQVLGMQGHSGVFADRVRLPAGNLHVLPDSLEDERGIFAQPLAAALQILRQVAVDKNQWVTVLGDGRLGLLAAQVLRNAGCAVRLLGHHQANLALCEKWSIRARQVREVTGRRDQDVVVDCTGSTSGLRTALQMVRPRGVLVLKSMWTDAAPLDLTSAVDDEIQILGSRSGPLNAAIAELAENAVDVASLIHRRFKLEQGVEAMGYAAGGGVLKVILNM